MKKFKIIFILVVVWVFSSYGLVISQEIQRNSAGRSVKTLYKRYEVKSGIIEYILSGNQKGFEIVYFDDWGMREARFRKAESDMLGQSNTVTIIERDWVYTIDPAKRLGTKVQDMEVYTILSEMTDLPEINVMERLLGIWGAARFSEEKILAKKCDLWRVEKRGQVFWLWEWLPLKSETKEAEGKTTMTAVNIELDVPIPPEKFEIPEGIKYIEGDLNSILISARPRAGRDVL